MLAYIPAPWILWGRYAWEKNERGTFENTVEQKYRRRIPTVSPWRATSLAPKAVKKTPRIYVNIGG